MSTVHGHGVHQLLLRRRGIPIGRSNGPFCAVLSNALVHGFLYGKGITGGGLGALEQQER